MADTVRAASSTSLRRDAILEAVAFAAERLLLAPAWVEVAEEVLARLGVAADVSRAYILESVTDDRGRACVLQRAEWSAPGVSAQVDNPVLMGAPWAEAGFGRWPEILGGGGIIAGPIETFPESEHHELASQQIVSLCAVPIRVGREWWGCIGFDDCWSARDWSGTELEALRAAAGVVGAAIDRDRSHRRELEAEGRYRAFVERMPAVTYTDIPVPGGVTQMGFVSPQIEQLLGYPPQAFLDRPELWYDLIHPDDLARLHATDAMNASDPSPFDEEYRMRAADGRWVWVHDTSTAILRPDGSIDHFLGFMFDITDRKEAEHQLRLAEERYRTAVEGSPAMTYQEMLVDGVYDPDNVQAFISPHVERILGYTREEWSQPGFWRRVTHPDDLPLIQAESDRVIAAGETTYRQEYRLIARDGHAVWFHDESALIVDDAGRPVMWQGVMVDITDRKLAEAQLRDAEERYRALVEHMPAIVYAESIPPRAEDLYLSPQVEGMLGYSAEEWRSTPGFWQSHLHPDDVERVMAVNADANRTGRPFVAEYRFLAGDGSWRWLRDHAVQVRDEDGRPRYWQGAIFDVTARMEAEERVRQTEGRLRALIENIPAVVYVEAPDANPRDFYIGPQVEAMFGYSAEEWTWTEDFWASRIHPDDVDRVLEADRVSTEQTGTYQAEYRFRRADGSYVWVHDEAVFVSDAGERGFWQGFIFDITERVRAEERVRLAEETYRTIVERNPAVIYTQEIDPSDPAIARTTYISPRAEELTGYTTEDIERDPTIWAKQIHPDDHDRVMEAEARSNEGGVGTTFSLEYRLIRKDGRVIWIHDEAQLVQIGGRSPYWQGFMVDITERKQAEERLEQALVVEREAAQRLRSLDEMKNTFLQAVSHDLRTPLSAILGLAITLERGDVVLEATETRELAGRIAHNARRLERLVANLLDMDRLARGIVEPTLEPTDVAGLARRVVEESGLVGAERLILDLPACVVECDAAKLERIMENLLANTARHAPADATVWVSVRPHEGGALLLVEDDGPGVPEDLREKIFEPFRQGPDAPSHSPGVGVGLTLVRRFAELHGGRAWVEERDGGGASFRVFLPGRAALAPSPGPA